MIASLIFARPGTLLFAGRGRIAMDPSCCCGPVWTGECDFFCTEGARICQVKVTLGGEVIPQFDCDNPGACPLGDYFLDLADTGSLSLCAYKLCIDDPCTPGQYVRMSLFISGHPVQTDELYVKFVMDWGCPITCGFNDGCGNVNVHIDESCDGDFPKNEFDCLNRLNAHQLNGACSTHTGGGATCLYVETVTITAIEC